MTTTRIAMVFVAAIVGVPGAAIAYAVPPSGPITIPRRWWSGAPAPPAARAAIVATTAAVAILVVATMTAAATAMALVATGVVLVVLAVADLRQHRLPHRLTAVAWIAAAVIVTIAIVEDGGPRPAVEAVATAAFVVAVMLGMALAFPGQLGLGDVNLAGVLAFSLAWAGWTNAAMALIVGLLVQAVVAAAAIIVGTGRRVQLPLGPALVVGWLVGVIALEPL